MKKNCWEMKNCGREPDGENAKELGICPAAIPGEFDGINEGNSAGRFCWAVAGTMCENIVQGTFANKFLNCINCDFFKQVNEEENREFILTHKKARERKKFGY